MWNTFCKFNSLWIQILESININRSRENNEKNHPSYINCSILNYTIRIRYILLRCTCFVIAIPEFWELFSIIEIRSAVRNLYVSKVASEINLKLLYCKYQSKKHAVSNEQRTYNNKWPAHVYPGRSISMTKWNSARKLLQILWNDIRMLARITWFCTQWCCCLRNQHLLK